MPVTRLVRCMSQTFLRYTIQLVDTSDAAVGARKGAFVLSVCAASVSC